LFIDYNSGTDVNIGTYDKPLKTINEALNRIDSNSSESVRLILLPGIYYVDRTIRVKSKGHFSTTNRLSIEALYLPDNQKWKPELMPVILTTAKPDTNFQFVYSAVGLMVDMEHLSIRGLKFVGHPYPQIPCYPIGRENAKLNDLEVSQCMFVGNLDASYIQVGVIVNGSNTMVDHCVFYGCNNATVFWQSDNGKKQNNQIKYSIICNAKNAVWASDADSGFIFDHNIVSKCKYFFLKNYYNETVYSFSSSIITENENYTGKWTEAGVVPDNFKIIEDKIIKEGKIELVSVKAGEEYIDKRYLQNPYTYYHQGIIDCHTIKNKYQKELQYLLLLLSQLQLTLYVWICWVKPLQIPEHYNLEITDWISN